MISKELPAGNVKVISEENKKIVLDVELRDSTEDWFYWKFKAVFPEKGVYDFHFIRDYKVGTRGPAVSRDQGETWNWLTQTTHESAQNFRFECRTPGEEIWFCQGIPYLQSNFEKFAAEFKGNPAFHLGTLCKSRKGRNVELLTVREGTPEHSMILTSRHHAQEMMATHVLEGFLRAILANTEFGISFRSRIALYAVPFVDKDGVEDGDQGKNRAPFDHGRDYARDTALYPETGAIRSLIDTECPVFILDLHCPWIRGGNTNEVPYMVGTGNQKIDNAMERFGKFLEQEAPPSAPYRNADNLPFGTGWNTSANYTKGATLKHYGCNKSFVSCSQTLEVPFANFGEITVTRKSMLEFGSAIAHAVYRYSSSH